jgi:hypothetical protein
VDGNEGGATLGFGRPEEVRDDGLGIGRRGEAGGDILAEEIAVYLIEPGVHDGCNVRQAGQPGENVVDLTLMMRVPKSYPSGTQLACKK